MANLRLFVAADLPAEVLAAVTELQVRLRPSYPSLRWLDPQTFHLTLKFLGGVAEERLGEVVRLTAAAAAGAAPGEVATGALAGFPGWRAPRVVVLECSAEPALTALHDRLQFAYASVGVAAEARAFRPHLTLARPKGRPERVARPAVELPPLRFRVGEIVLYQSFLGSGGARYQALDRFALGS